MFRFQLPDMACGGCVRSVTQALLSLDPNARVTIELSIHEVRIDSNADETSLRDVLAEAGFSTAKQYEDDSGRARDQGPSAI